MAAERYLWSCPSEDLIGYAEAARICGVKPSTLAHYLWRGDPRGRPFPQPDLRVGRTPLWRRSTIERWQAGRLGRGARTDLMTPESLAEEDT